MLSDLRYSARGLARTPGLTIALLLTIAIGIGGNAIVAGFIRGSLQRTTLVPDADRVLSLFSRDASGGFVPVSPDEFERVKSQATSFDSVFESIGALREQQGQVQFDGQSSWASIGLVTPELLNVLNVSKARGVVVSHRLWLAGFGGTAPFVGKSLTINGRPHRIAGIMPETFDGLYDGRSIDVWAPLDWSSLNERDRQGHTLWAVGRLRAGATADQARAEITTALGGADRAVVAPYTGIEPEVAGGLTRIRTILPIAAVMVFLVACANVATFLLSRATSRAHETSVRIAIGADRGRIARQLLADAGLVAMAGTTAGAIVAVWSSRLIPALFFDQDAAELSFAPNVPAVAIACAACVVITIASGLVPLFEVRDSDPAAVLRRETGGLSNAARRARSALVVGQMACSCLLLISTGLLLASFQVSLRTTLGNQLGQPVIATVTSSGGFGLEEQGATFFDTASSIARATPGVTSAAWASALPGSRPSWQPVRLEPLPTGSRDALWRVDSFPSQPPTAVTFTLKAGRSLGGRDTPGSCLSVMVNQEAAALLGGDPVGRLMQDSSGRKVEIVGVIERGQTPDPIRPTVYYYREQAEPPVAAGSTSRFRIPTWSEHIDPTALDANVVSSSYFGSVGARLTSGAGFPVDVPSSGCRVAIVNTEAEELYFGGNAAGRVVLNPAGQRIEVIGVVKTEPLRVSQHVIEPAIYYPMAQNFLPRMTMIIGTSGPVDPIVDDLRARLTTRGGVKPRVVTLDQHLSWTSLAAERITTTLVGVCAAMALVLSMMGVYGAMADAVERRRRELALRVALGAQAWRLVRHVLWEGARLSVVGAFAGGLAAFAVERWALHTPSNASVMFAWLSAPVSLAVVLMLAAVLPARRAVRADPLTLMKGA